MAKYLQLCLPLALVLCLTGMALSAPPEADQQQQQPSDNTLLNSVDFDPTDYIEATPNADFTLNNISSTIEEIYAEAHIVSEPGSYINLPTRSKRRPCACSTTIGSYGGRLGTAFVDVPTNPCSVHITDIWIRHAGIVDGIQVKYNLSNGNLQTMPRRGGPGGGATHISVPQGGKIIGLFGGVANYTHISTWYGPVISQLRILVLDAGQELQIYGPYGSHPTDSGTFAVYGDIKSIFGYHRQYLDGLGAFYVPWGACGSPCARTIAN